jgi:4-amino-4-deoxy-L-arabinose transferase-like glycosyltransferase
MTTIREQATGADVPAVQSVHEPASRRSWFVGWLGAIACIAALGAYHWLIYVPHEDLPHKLTILDRLFDVTVAGAILLSGLLLGLRCLRLLRVHVAFSRLERIALASGLGLGLLSLGVLGLGMLHLYYPASFALLLLALPLLFPSERRWLAQMVGAFAGSARQLLKWRGPSPVDTVACVLLAGLSVSTLVFTFLRDLNPTPVLAYDSYQYHWAVPELLLRSHSMRAFPGWAHANLPFNTEMLSLIALSLQSSVAATLVQDAFIVLTALLVFALISHYFGATAAWLAVAAQLTVPFLIAYTSLSYVETALIFYGFAALFILIRWLEMVGRSAQVRLRLLVLAGLLVGLDLGVKYTAIEYLPGVGLVVLAGLVIYSWRRRKLMSLRAALGTAVQAIVAVAGGIALAFGPWAVKDWLLLGDPIYPSLAGIFRTPLWNVVRTQTLESTFRSFGPPTWPYPGVVTRFHLFALDLFFRPLRYGEGVSFPLGRMALGAILVIPFLSYVLWFGWRGTTREQRGQLLVVAVIGLSALLGFVVWTFSGALVERYALPPVILATVLGAALFGWFHDQIPRRGAVLSWLLLLSLIAVCGQQEWAYMFGGGEGPTPNHYLEYAYWTPLPLLSGQVSEQAFSRERFVITGGLPLEYWQMVDYVNHSLPHDGKLLMLGRGTGYFFEDREYVADSGGDWVPYLVSAGKTSDGILRLLRAQGFTYVVYDSRVTRWLVDGYKNHVLASYLPAYFMFQQCSLDYIGTWGQISLYRVPPATASVPAGTKSGTLTNPMRRCGSTRSASPP